jgi:hypothetical protein
MTGELSVKRVEIWAYIKARAKLGKSSVNVYNATCIVCGNNEISFATVRLDA